ncbi:MAG: 50S ribosomal protein L30 [Anaerolinea sp.]|nr:50S ribosomal protein L30 [Anaerolinea sp.]
MPDKLRVTQVKSTISHIARNRATARALGLRGIGSTVEVVDNEATRGMVRQVRFLVTVEEIAGVVGEATPRAGVDLVAAQASPGAGANDGVGRIGGDVEEKA